MILAKFLSCRSKILGLCWHFVLGGLIGAFLLLVLLSLAVFQLKKEYAGRVYPRVFLDSVSMAGKTQNELDDFLSNQNNRINQQKIVFFWNGNNQVQKWEVDPTRIDFYLDRLRTSQELMAYGRKEKGLEGFWELYRLLLFPQTIKPSFSYNKEKLNGMLAEIRSSVDRPAKDALFDFKEGRVVNFQDSQDGRELEGDKVSNLIILAFSTLDPKETELNLDLPVKPLLAKVRTDQTNNLGIKEKLAEGESFFFDSIPSRIHNIALAASRINGVVVPPGETFSFAEKVGTISAQFGYKQAYVIKDKKTILEDGGGVCQVSTTLFRAALNAGLPIIERKAHYYRVGFYEQGGYPPGIDATVYPPSPDFKFQNDTANYILIQTSFDKEKKRLAFTLYGTSDGRKAEVGKPIIHSQSAPPEPVYIDDPSLPVGVVQQTDKPHFGAKVSFVRKVWWANGQLKEENKFISNYSAWPAFYLRGTKQ
ncbi:MAG: VanW family protein [bacterium]|nr:VanW family protein [bacterium]